MPKFRIGVEETFVYSVLVSARTLAAAKDIACETVGDGSIDAVDGTCVVFDSERLPDHTAGPFPRTDF
jgi:hypothetical protein